MSEQKKLEFAVIKVECLRPLHDKFKAKCRQKDENMSMVLLRMVKEYLKT